MGAAQGLGVRAVRAGFLGEVLVQAETERVMGVGRERKCSG